MKFLIEFIDAKEDEVGYNPLIARTVITTTLEEPDPQEICDGDCGGFAVHSIQVTGDVIQNFCEDHIGFWLTSILQPEAASWDTPQEFGSD